MFCEEFDYWMIKLFGPPYAYIGLGVLKEAKNYLRNNESQWKYVWTTLDDAYLEERELNVKIDKNDPFYVYGDFGGKFAVYGDWKLEENKITKYWGYKLEGNKICLDIDKVFNGGSWLYPTGRSKIRRLKQTERKLLNNLTQARG